MTHAQTPQSQETSLRVAVIVRSSVRLLYVQRHFKKFLLHSAYRHIWEDCAIVFYTNVELKKNLNSCYAAVMTFCYV